MLGRKTIEKLGGWEMGRQSPGPSSNSCLKGAGQNRAIDMTAACELEIQAHCPNAEVVYDLFQVVAKYGREVIDRVRVDQVNQSLLTAYLMRDELKQLWFHRHPDDARQAWERWLEQAQGSGIAALGHFALKLKAYLHGILSRCRHRLNTSIVEGINNTIKVIKRRDYGHRISSTSS